MKKLSVIVPTYKEPEVLDICLKALTTKFNKFETNIIVVIDGYYEENAEVLSKYFDQIQILVLPENMGMIRAMNMGVYNADSEWVFIINDDNIMPEGWQPRLLHLCGRLSNNVCVSLNQVEPTPSIFKPFIIEDLGRDPKTFDINRWYEFENWLSAKDMDETGGTSPFLIRKQDYLKIGGWDETYPGPWVVDWEFFIKCQLNGISLLRHYNCPVYHFGSIATQSEEKKIIEANCHAWFKYKWGINPYHNLLTK